MVLSDSGVRVMVHLAVYLLQPVRAWHGQQSVSLRSAQENCAWYCEQACGAGLRAIKQVAERAMDPTAVREILLGRLPAGLLRNELPDTHRVSHPLVIEDDQRAELAGTLTLSLVCRRVWSAMWHSLLNDDHVEATLASIREDYHERYECSAEGGSGNGKVVFFLRGTHLATAFRRKQLERIPSAGLALASGACLNNVSRTPGIAEGRFQWRRVHQGG